MNAVIRIDGLSKRYSLRRNMPRYGSLRDEITQRTRDGIGRLLGRSKPENSSTEEFWALKDVSLSIRQGDRVGVVGRNGAGKSTLLKILSRITDPTEGAIEIAGRVSSLLEVGTGFHPELSGRENIYLNGAILGMRKDEIRRKFDDIVQFAEVERFLDTPVKRYSSGMYVRLAFAVAAHLEPDILIVDEVLAVGDAEFQKRCLNKMEDSSREGRTIVFVSHNMSAVEALCNRVIYLDAGHVRSDTRVVSEGIRSYIVGSNGDLPSSWAPSADAPKNDWFNPISFRLVNAHNQPIANTVSYVDEVWCLIDSDVLVLDVALTMGIAVFDEEGRCLFWSYQTDIEENAWPKFKVGRNCMRVRIPIEILNGGVYRIELIGGLHFRQWIFQPGHNAPSIYITISDLVSKSPYWLNKRATIIAPKLTWDIN